MSEMTIASKIAEKAHFFFTKGGYIVFGKYDPDGVTGIFPREMLTDMDENFVGLQLEKPSYRKANQDGYGLDELEDPEEYVPGIRGMSKALRTIKKAEGVNET